MTNIQRRRGLDGRLGFYVMQHTIDITETWAMGSGMTDV